MDYQQPMYYHSMEYKIENMSFQTKQVSVSYDCNVFDVRVDMIGYDPRTTFMIRNIPNKYTIKDLSEEIDFYFANTYDFLYLPCDFKVPFCQNVEQLQCRLWIHKFHQHKLPQGLLY